MKITPRITELLFDLSENEESDNANYLNGDIGQLRKNLLELYRVTKYDASREAIIAIMSEAGYPWFGRFARASNRTLSDLPQKAAANKATLVSKETVSNELPSIFGQEAAGNETLFMSGEEILSVDVPYIFDAEAVFSEAPLLSNEQFLDLLPVNGHFH